MHLILYSFNHYIFGIVQSSRILRSGKIITPEITHEDLIIQIMHYVFKPNHLSFNQDLEIPSISIRSLQTYYYQNFVKQFVQLVKS